MVKIYALIIYYYIYLIYYFNIFKERLIILSYVTKHNILIPTTYIPLYLFTENENHIAYIRWCIQLHGNISYHIITYYVDHTVEM